MLQIIPAIIISYLIGSIPTAYLWGRIFQGIDIRKFGSGNVGATNALRVLGKTAGITVLVLDVLKGLLPVAMLGDYYLKTGLRIAPDSLRIILGISCICGHNWSLFLRFKGGKGVASSLGVLIALAFKIYGFSKILGLLILVWLLSFVLFRIVSLSSVLAAIAFPLLAVLFGQSRIIIAFSLLASVFIVVRHLSNLKRILQGKEHRI